LALSLQPTLDWLDSFPAATYYQVQLSTSDQFTSLIVDQSNVTASQFRPATSLTPGLRYFWRARAVNSADISSAWSDAASFRTRLPSPALKVPQAGQSLLTDRPSFDWADVTGAEKYQLQISATSNFSVSLLNITITESNYQTARDLPQSQILYWRARAISSAVTGLWSTARSFTSGNPPSVPSLLSPSNGATVSDTTPLLDWSNSSVPDGVTFDRYQIQISKQSNFSTVLLSKYISGRTSSAYTPDADLSADTIYYWRVRAYSADGHYSGWSAVFTFRTTAKPSSLHQSNSLVFDSQLILDLPAYPKIQ